MADAYVTQTAVEVATNPSPGLETTQAVVEILHGPVQPSPPAGVYVSQSFVEVIVQSPPYAPVLLMSQALVEVVEAVEPPLRISQLVAELIHGPVLPPPDGVHVSTLVTEVISYPPRAERVTQLTTEVILGRPLPQVDFEVAGDYIGLTWVEWTLDPPAETRTGRGMMRVGRGRRATRRKRRTRRR
jgi:hypothetical protein